jgi:hypothetical protein
MTPGCDAEIADERLIEYWSGDLEPGQVESLESHLFACAGCTARLDRLASLASGIASLVRQGRVSGVISRSMLNRMQREGVHVRMYAVSAGEVVPCAVFPDDDIVVVSLRANLADVPSVALRVTGTGDALIGEADGVPVSETSGEGLWATPGNLVRQMPSTELHLTLRSADAGRRLIGSYTLDHTA